MPNSCGNRSKIAGRKPDLVKRTALRSDPWCFLAVREQFGLVVDWAKESAAIGMVPPIGRIKDKADRPVLAWHTARDHEVGGRFVAAITVPALSEVCWSAE